MKVSRQANRRGFSVTELLVVIAIIGIIGLVAIPNFINFMRASALKSAMRSFTGDIRGARQLAITKNMLVKLEFTPGAGQRTYQILQSPNDVTNQVWTALPNGASNRQLDKMVYIASTTFEDEDTPANQKVDIIFRPNGSLYPDPIPTETEAGQSVTKVALRTDWKVMVNEFKIYFDQTGRFRVVSSNF